MIEVYTDGACRGNPGPGGWAAVVRDADGSRELTGFDPSTTNNRMELTAAIEALATLPPDSQVRVLSDSKYVIDGITNWCSAWIRRGWRKSDGKPVLNRELWQRLIEETSRMKVDWRWVEGHSGQEENERCDLLANMAIDHAGPVPGNN